MMLVVAYDITDNARRLRLATLLQGIGDRVQKSVFVLSIEPVRVSVLCATIAKIVDPVEDSVLLFRQCGKCWEAVEHVGRDERPRPVLYWAAL